MRGRNVTALILPALLVACGAAGSPPALPPPPAAPPAAATAPAPPAQVFAADEPEPRFADPARRRKLAAAFPVIDGLVEAATKGARLPGVVLGVIIDGELAHQASAGFADLESRTPASADTVYRIGSITKSFTALAVLALRDEGALSLDDPLARWLPEAAGLVYPTRDAAPITLRQVLTHTSGLPRVGRLDYATPSRPEMTEAEVLSGLAGLALERAPGSRFAYSNLGYSLLGLVVGRASHASVRSVVARKILGPLGMSSTGWDDPSKGAATPYEKGPGGKMERVTPWRFGASEAAGGIQSTLRDMARYAAFHLAAYPARSGPEGAIRRSSVREAHESARPEGLGVRLRPAAAPGEPAVALWASAYGFAWQVERSCAFEHLVAHDGAVLGGRASLMMLPEQGVAVVALTNFKGDEPLDPLTRDALLALRKTGGLVPRVSVARLVPGFGQAAARLLAVYGAWDEQAYRAMLAAGRRFMPVEERAELASYRALHGACKGYSTLDVLSPVAARLAFDCERGKLEMLVTIDPKDSGIRGFSGVSRDVPAPAAMAQAAARIATLLRRWDGALYAKVLGKNTHRSPASRKAVFEGIRARHGACKVRSFTFTRGASRQGFTLGCERGGDVELGLAVDAKEPDRVPDFSLSEPGFAGLCPVK